MVLEQRRLTMQAGIAAVLAALVLSLTGCGNFFVYPGSLNGTSTSGVDYVFVSNSTSGQTYINGYAITNGTLAATSGSPVNTSVVPSSMVVTTNDGILYVSTCGATVLSAATGTCVSGLGNNGISAYSIGTSGALATLNNGGGVAGGFPVSMDVSPDGQWLLALDGVNNTLTVYGINTSTGALSAKPASIISSIYTITPYQVRIAPTGNYVAVTLGAAGTVVYPFTTSSGTLGNPYSIPAINSGNGGSDYSVAMDSSNNLYIGRTGGTTGTGGTLGVYSYQLGSNGATLINASTTSPYVTGLGPRSMVLSSNYNYLYTGNEKDTPSGGSTEGDISEFSQSSGKLTSLGIPIGAPILVDAMGRDNSGNYIVAAGYNSTANGLILYSIGSSGGLSVSAGAVTGAYSNSSLNIPSVIALTH